MKGKKIIMKKLGFTLAEVLITLVIIGVIAAMTVPTLMNNTNAQEFRSALKKAISGLNQALTLHYALESMTASDYPTAKKLVDNVFRQRMSVVDSKAFSPVADMTTKVTANGTEVSISDTFQNPSQEHDDDSSAVFTTADGMKFWVANYTSSNSDSQSTLCNTYNTVPCIPGASADSNGVSSTISKPNLLIDVNGDRKPNVITTSSQRPKDIYMALIYSQKVVPFGDPTQEVMFDKEVKTTGAAAGG